MSTTYFPCNTRASLAEEASKDSEHIMRWHRAMMFWEDSALGSFGVLGVRGVLGVAFDAMMTCAKDESTVWECLTVMVGTRG